MTSATSDSGVVGVDDRSEKTSSRTTAIRAALDHPMFDYHLVVVISVILLCLGLLMVISSSSVIAGADMDDPYYFGKRQIIFAVIGVAMAWGFSLLPEKMLRGLARPALFLAVLLMLLTVATPLGVDIAGNRNWMSFGPTWTQFQPSEFAKLAIIVWGAKNLSDKAKRLNDMREWFLYILASFVIIGLVVVQKDQGTAMVMAAMVILVLVAAGTPWRLLLGLAGVAVVGVVALIIIQPYRMDRIWAFLNPNADPYGLNLQARRSLYALASGGWFGRGLGSSRQKWGLLAEGHTDYIFSILGEELGLLGTLTVIALFLGLAYAGIRIAARSASSFSRLMAVGVVAWFSVQAFVNIAVAIRLIPVMGVTLPMISYGGSSLIANLLALGLLAGCARREPEARALLTSRQRKPRVSSIVREKA
ncbi:MAG: putative lipid II flippase FtsW [Propionibacteriaceae bacterium]|nr:putative lipid II flippase FtsW [Propionibacteriaceae bacterium]